MTIASAARALNSRARARRPGAKRLPPLLLMSDGERLADPLPLLGRLPRGAGIVLRLYGLPAPEAEARARALAAACRARGLTLIVAGDARLARAVRAGGLHLPERMLRRSAIAVLRAGRPPGFLLTAACHSARALREAARRGVDAALLAPVFATISHPGRKPLGALRFARLARTSPIPVYALGGVTEKTARRLRDSGAAGIAGIGFALDPKKSVV